MLPLRGCWLTGWRNLPATGNRYSRKFAKTSPNKKKAGIYRPSFIALRYSLTARAFFFRGAGLAVLFRFCGTRAFCFFLFIAALFFFLCILLGHNCLLGYRLHTRNELERKPVSSS